MRFKQVYDGEWVQPIMRGYRMQCCGCGFVHRLNFKVKKRGKRGYNVLFQAFQVKRKKKKK